MTVSQPELIGHILKWLDRGGVKEINTRQMNAVIKAATDICDALDRPDVPPTEGMASKGGRAAAAKLTADQRRERARKAACARWGKSAPVRRCCDGSGCPACSVHPSDL